MDALAGVRIIDFSWAMAGPYATEVLAFMGAEVIRVESMTQLDVTRTQPHPITKLPFDPDQAYYFMDANLNKLGIRLNLSQPRAVALAKKLVEVSDVVVESFRPGVMTRLGLSYEVLREVKPDIVMLSTSAAGASGPESQYAGYAPLFSAVAGLGELTGYPDGAPTEMRMTVDTLNAFSNALAILAALNYRRRTGQGQYIDASSEEGVACVIGDSLMDFTMNGRVQSRVGNRDEAMVPHNCYPCLGEDRWVSIAVATDEEWRALCQAMGRPELAEDKWFSDARVRWQNQEDLDSLIEQWTRNYTPYEVMHRLQAVGVAAVPSFDGQDMFSDPHLNERQAFQIIEHPVIGSCVVLSPPWQLSATPARITRHAPLLGEHNSYVFGGLLGLSAAEITRLEAEHILW